MANDDLRRRINDIYKVCHDPKVERMLCEFDCYVAGGEFELVPASEYAALLAAKETVEALEGMVKWAKENNCEITIDPNYRFFTYDEKYLQITIEDDDYSIRKYAMELKDRPKGWNPTLPAAILALRKEVKP